ncbi:MAG: MASE3 domain-containing protein, partial [Deltaproteobacteria bacterium]
MLRFLNRNREGVIGLALIAGLFVLGLRHFLFAHAVAETFSIVIAASIFLFVWNARRFLDNDYLFFLGVGYLFVGIVDFMHMITYKGMGVLSVPAPNVSTQLWVAGRYMEALIFLCAPLCARGRVWAVAPFAGFAALTGLAFLSILVWQNFPACYVEGEGLTAFKEASEWGIAAVLTAAMALLWYRRAFFDAAVFRWIQCALATTVVSEILFSRYVSVYDHTNLLGHMLKVASYYFVYKAIVEKGLSRPYDLLFRNLKQSENELRWYRDRLEGLVRERTAQLESSKVSLEKEVAERSRIQDELKMRNVLLKLLSKSGSRREYLESVVRLLKGWTRCENVAIRLIVAGKELVFGAWRGFDHAFCAAEAHLFLDRDLCVCTRVFKEEPEAVESSFMTPHGSFYCEDMERFFNTLPAHALPRFRGACRSAGFVFVAITPIRYGDRIIGLIHFADRKGHPGLQKKVAAIEVATSVVGEGVRKFEL